MRVKRGNAGGGVEQREGSALAGRRVEDLKAAADKEEDEDVAGSEHMEVVSSILRAMVAACRCGGPTMGHDHGVDSGRRTVPPPAATTGKNLVEGRRAMGELVSVGATLARRRAFEGGSTDNLRKASLDWGERANLGRGTERRAEIGIPSIFTVGLCSRAWRQARRTFLMLGAGTSFAGGEGRRTNRTLLHQKLSTVWSF
jgi:hypothetical protein